MDMYDFKMIERDATVGGWAMICGFLEKNYQRVDQQDHKYVALH